jgi:hypothetical protein
MMKRTFALLSVVSLATLAVACSQAPTAPRALSVTPLLDCGSTTNNSNNPPQTAGGGGCSTNNNNNNNNNNNPPTTASKP